MFLRRFCIILLALTSVSLIVNAQITPGVYISETEGIRHELKASSDYLVLTTYKTSPAEFLQTIGGFYTTEDGHLKVDLEFNSDYEKDSVTQVDIPFRAKEDILIFKLDKDIVFEKLSTEDQDLDGAWLFATRGPDTGQERRGEMNARKTLKFLIDGRFQWIAYQTESMKFSGTGGGSFSSKNGKYVESIEFFSRDNSRVGAKLKFEYNLIDEDWHHTGLNSKGEPLYEIWGQR